MNPNMSSTVFLLLREGFCFPSMIFIDCNKFDLPHISTSIAKKCLKVQCVEYSGMDLAKMVYNIHKFVLICVKSHENKNHCVFVTIE